jgi:hypothetical protein
MVHIKKVELSLVDQVEVLSRLPVWAQERQVTEVIRVDFIISQNKDLDVLLRLIIEEDPLPIGARLVDEVLNDIDTETLCVLGVYPSGAVRTIGVAVRYTDRIVLLAPFGYWSLIDPDAAVQDLSGTVSMCAIQAL